MRKNQAEKDKQTYFCSATASALAQDALSALVNLGYSRSEAFHAVSATLAEAPELDLAALIQQSLKKMGRD